MIGQLIDNGYAYQAANGDVMYDVHKFAPYGKLSGKKLEDLRAGARVEVDERQARSARFRAVEVREARRAGLALAVGRWAARAGTSSARRCPTKELGEHFDIHGGGLDLKFPHHENEIAQTCGATRRRRSPRSGCTTASSTSTTRRCRSRSAISSPTREVLREDQASRGAALLPAVEPLPRADELLARPARSGGGRAHALYTALRDVPESAAICTSRRAATREFHAAMDDDFNTPEAIAVLQGLARELNTRARRTARASNGQAARPANCARSAACSACSEDPASSCAARHPVSAAGGAPARPIDATPTSRRASRRALGGPQGEELGRVRPHPGRAGRGRRDPRGQAGRHDHLAPGLRPHG